MSTYEIYFNTGASTVVKVEAGDYEEAVELAYDGLPTGLCAQCSGWGTEPGIDLGDDWTVDDTFHVKDGEGVES